MIALVVIGLAAVVALSIVWSRVGLARSERRSMRSYEHTLHVLGDVTRRSEAAARIRPVRREDSARGYVRTEVVAGSPGDPQDARDEPPLAQPEPGPATPALPKLEDVPVQFSDDSDAFERAKEAEARATVVAVPAARPRAQDGSAGEDGGEHGREDTGDDRGEDSDDGGEGARKVAVAALPTGRRLRRAVPPAAAAVAVVVVVGLVLVAVHVDSPGGTHGRASHHSRRPPAPSTHRGTTPTTTAPSAIVPVSTSPTEVAFVEPKGTYSILFNDAGGTCWVGIEQAANGPYVWQATLTLGQSAAYQAKGPIVIRMGAPKYLGVKVNGLPARLPGYVQPYDLVFNPASPPSAA